ncbi:hypothetical protein CLOBY_41600 [Clostridium saccharobutylicum]|nr:hypothetical protein CLOSC_42240 [Clostridium saccharobutylicum]AQS02397.1 hypothetical protein CSACC_42300 [Clostridium saccharobutylicum]AQS12002.1 hypothetical protein CLOBY_41600 [Clostridium saccharobutylicum]AQS16380.1 hypothetical protein CLOSACC_42300 [Clostridium saccharobutylicum]OOM18656.1 hypothetical protein CLSAB_04250 [Clostridium saccharobutylicum]
MSLKFSYLFKWGIIMDVGCEISEQKLKLIKDKLNYFNDNIQDKNELLNELLNIILDLPTEFTVSKSELKTLGAENNTIVSECSLEPCLYHYTYIWECNGESYWVYITKVDACSVYGWKWCKDRWVYFILRIRRIDSFICF